MARLLRWMSFVLIRRSFGYASLRAKLIRLAFEPF